jgi:hypothetical protein
MAARPHRPRSELDGGLLQLVEGVNRAGDTAAGGSYNGQTNRNSGMATATTMISNGRPSFQ